MPDHNVLEVVLINPSTGAQYAVSAGGGVSQQDNTAFTAGTDSGSPSMGFVGSTAVTAGRVGVARIQATREWAVSLYDSSGNAISTLPVSLASVPSHAVTNAGTFAVQESGSALTALQLIDDGVYTDDTSTHATGTSKGYGIMAVATPTDGSVDANDFGHVAMTTARQLKVDASGVAVPVTDNSSSLSVDWNGTQPVTGSGNATGALRVELANNGTGVISTVSTVSTVSAITAFPTDLVLTDDNTFTPASTKVLMVGATADETSPDSVNEGDGGALRMTLDRYLKVVAQQADTVRASGTERSVTRTAVAAASSGNNTIATNSNGGLTIRVYAMALVSAAANNIYFTADAGGTVIFGGSTNKIQLAANGGFVLPYNPLGWFDTSANTDVVMNLSAASSVSGVIVWAEV